MLSCHLKHFDVVLFLFAVSPSPIFCYHFRFALVKIVSFASQTPMSINCNRWLSIWLSNSYIFSNIWMEQYSNFNKSIFNLKLKWNKIFNKCTNFIRFPIYSSCNSFSIHLILILWKLFNHTCAPNQALSTNSHILSIFKMNPFSIPIKSLASIFYHFRFILQVKFNRNKFRSILLLPYSRENFVKSHTYI